MPAIFDKDGEWFGNFAERDFGKRFLAALEKKGRARKAYNELQTGDDPEYLLRNLEMYAADPFGERVTPSQARTEAAHLNQKIKSLDKVLADLEESMPTQFNTFPYREWMQAQKQALAANRQVRELYVRARNVWKVGARDFASKQRNILCGLCNEVERRTGREHYPEIALLLSLASEANGTPVKWTRKMLAKVLGRFRRKRTGRARNAQIRNNHGSDTGGIRTPA